MFNKVIKSYKISIGTPFLVEETLDMEKNGNNIKEDLSYCDNLYDDEDNSSNLCSKNGIKEAEKQAELIIKEAERKAVSILEMAEKEKEEAKKDAELAKKKGYEDGYNEGYKKGYDESIKKVKTAYQQEFNIIESIKEKALTEYKELLAGAEADVVNMVIDIVKRIIHKELNNKDILLGIIKEAFDKCSEEKEATLCLSPEDYDYFYERMDELKQISRKVIDLHLKRDASLRTGGCIVETAHGSINTSTETKMKKVEEALKTAVGEA